MLSGLGSSQGRLSASTLLPQSALQLGNSSRRFLLTCDVNYYLGSVFSLVLCTDLCYKLNYRDMVSFHFIENSVILFLSCTSVIAACFNLLSCTVLFLSFITAMMLIFEYEKIYLI